MAIRAATAYTQILPSLRGFVTQLRRDLRQELAKVNPTVSIDPDVDWSKVEREAPKKGAEAGGEFARAFKARVEAALRSIADIKVGADTTEAQTEIAGLKTRLEALRDLRIGVDIDAGEATAEIQAISNQLQRLSRESADPQVRLDTASAAAQLSAFKSQLDRLDGRNVDVDVNVDRNGDGLRSAIFLSRSISGLALAGATIAPAFVPALAAATAGMLGLGAAAAGAGAGVGAFIAVAIPGIAAVTNAVQAQTAADKSNATQSIKGASTRIQSAYAAQQAAKRVADAQRDADRTAEEGAHRVARAREEVTLAHQRAAEQIESAERRVADAEDALSRAQADQRTAQEALTQARKDAARALQDLREQTVDLALSEESAQIALIEARQRQAVVESNANATALERRKAALSVAEAENRLADVRRDQHRTTSELNDAERKGIEGSGEVRSAQERLHEVVSQVARASRDNRDAQRELATAQGEAARNIRDAERDLSLARQEAARANEDAARRVADALAAQAQQAQMAQAGTAGGSAAIGNLAYAMSQLTPWQRKLYDGFIQLREGFTQWTRSLEPSTIPVLLQGMKLIQQLFPLLTPLVKATAGAFTDLLSQASRALKDPFWKDFFGFLASTAGPSIKAFGSIFGNLAKGFAGVLMAFGPFSAQLTQGLVGLSKRFAQWGANLAENPSFKAFIAYVRELWPDLSALFTALFAAIGNVIRALAPLGGPVLAALTGIAQVIAAMPPGLLVAIGGAILGIAYATKIWAIVTALLNRTMKANIILLIAAAVAGLVVWLVRTYQTSEKFRNVVNTAFRAVASTAQWLWDTILKPTFNGMQIAFTAVGKAAVWFYQNALKPAWNGVAAVVAWAWDHVLKPYFAFFKAGIDLLVRVVRWWYGNLFKPTWTAIGTVVRWVWDHVLKPYWGFFSQGIRNLVTIVRWWYNQIFKPTWTAIGNVVKWVWNTVLRPQFDGFKRGIRDLGSAARWLWSNAIKPAWNAIASGITWVWKNLIRPQIDAFKSAVGKIGDAFKAAKKVIKTVWDAIGAVVKEPVNIVIGLYNNGIAAPWNRIAKAVSLDLYLKRMPRLATGGVLPGYRPGVDTIPAILSPGEGILRPEVVRAIGPETVHSWNASAMSGRPIEGFATGGIAGTATSLASSVSGFLSGPTKWIKEAILGPVNRRLREITGSDLGKLLARLPRMAINGLIGRAKKLVGGLFGGAGGSPLGTGATFAKRQAQRMMPLFGWPGVGPMWHALERLWHGESGWRASAHNPSSGAHGIPQSLPGRKMASEGADWYTNPVTQIRWGLKYIRGRYGNPINAFSAWQRRSPHWYDNGGMLQPGANVALNGTKRPEAVLTAAQWDTMRTIAERAGRGGDTINVNPRYALLDERRLADTLYATRLRERADRPV